MNLQEQKIINGLKRGDNWAYQLLYDQHYVVLCQMASAIVKDDFLAQTIVNDLIIHIYETRETFIITTSLRSYLVRSVRNRCLNHFQTKRAKREINFSQMDAPEHWLLSMTDPNAHPLGILLENEMEQEIHQAIERLPDECKTVFKKSRFEDKNSETIATELNISVNTVKYHLKNALARLRKDLGKYL